MKILVDLPEDLLRKEKAVSAPNGSHKRTIGNWAEGGRSMEEFAREWGLEGSLPDKVL